MTSGEDGAVTVTHFEQPLRQTWPRTISGVARAATTVFTTPPVPGHNVAYFRTTAKNLIATDVRLQPGLNEELRAVANVVEKHFVTVPYRVIPRREMIGEFGVLMQFTSYMPSLNPYAVTDFADCDRLYQAIIRAGRQQPIDFSKQLEIALRQTNGDLLEAVWRLFIVSRQYARWFDEEILEDMPKFSDTEILTRMDVFWKAVAACKKPGDGPYQDSAGDVYYCWTHALGKLLYAHYGKQGILSNLLGAALHNGTRLNHGLAHRYNPQSVESDHTIAASYGNAIGELFVAKLRKSE